jgi:uncharacterized lipoprotein
MKISKLIIVMLCVTQFGACASWLPDDPFENTRETEPLKVPEGMDSPATDATLTTKIGEGELVKGGHKPPSPEAPAEMSNEAPTDPESKAQDSPN